MGPWRGLILCLLFGIWDSHAATGVELKEYAQFTVEPSDIVVKAGDDMVLKCSAVAKTMPIISWRKNRVPVTLDSRVQVLPDGSLKISGVQSGDEAGYQCIATVKSDADLIVVSRLANVKMAEMTTPEDAFIVKGGAESDTVRFTCDVKSSPPNPDITWTVNETETIIASEKYVILPGGVLQVRDIDHNDAGLYRCRVTNPVSGKQRYGTINRLHYKGVIEPPYDPTFVVRPRSATVRNGTRTVLECVVNGISKPNIIWMKNENEEVQFDDRVKIAGDGNLLFDPVTIEDTGRYTCHVTEDMVEQALLIVIYKPSFTLKIRDTRASVGGKVRLSCAAVGEEAPFIYWLKNGEFVMQENARFINGYLDISDLGKKDTGIYQCFASNDAGNIQAAALLQISEPTVEIPVRSIFVHPSFACCDGVTRRVPCRVENQAFIGWLGPDGRPIDTTDSSQRVYVEEGASNALVIKNITSRDGGRYTCRGNVTSGTFTLFTGYAANVPGQVQYLTHLGDGTVDIKVHGYPSPVVTWRKNGFAIDHTAERYQILPGGSLRIRNVSLSDGGKYRPYFSQMGLGVNQGKVITVIVQEPCERVGCDAPFNVGCKNVGGKPMCLCPTCNESLAPMCGSDGVQYPNPCEVRRQSCLFGEEIEIVQNSSCPNLYSSGLDIAFMLDSNSNMSENVWRRLKQFVKSLVSKFEVGEDKAQVAAIAFGTEAVVVFRFSDNKTKDNIVQSFDELKQHGSFRYIDRALELANKDLFTEQSGMRPNVAKVAVLVTDGIQTKGENHVNPDVASYTLQRRGVIVYALGFGNDTSESELQTIASERNYSRTSESLVELGYAAAEVASGISEAPFSTPESSQVIILTKDDTVEITLTGYSAADVQWRINGRSLEKLGVDRYQVLPDGSLLIRDVRRSDAGRYFIYITSWNLPVGTPAEIINVEVQVPCEEVGCNAPYNRGCENMYGEAVCICPECDQDVPPVPVCSSDGVQDRSKCMVERQSCLVGKEIEIAQGGPCENDCDHLVDLGFVVDSSSSIGKANWDRMMRFLMSLTSKLNVNADRTHIGVVTFDAQARVEFDFQVVQDTDELNERLVGMTWHRGLKNTALGLQLASDRLFSYDHGMRSLAGKVAVVLTDREISESRHDEDLAIVSADLKSRGVHVFSIGVGMNISTLELEGIASKSENVFTAPTFNDLLVISNHLRAEICQVRPCTMDIAFIVDSSGSISRRNWGLLKSLLKELLKYMNIGPDGTHVSTVIYSTEATVQFHFDALKGSEITAENYGNLFDDMELEMGYTFIDKALRLAKSDVFTPQAGMRSSVSKVAILFTDGQQTVDQGPYENPAMASTALQDDGVQVFAFGIGGNLDPISLLEIAGFKGTRVFRASSFDSMEVPAKMILGSACSGAR